MLGYLDCFSGVAGNMLLAAAIDAGVSPRWLRETVGRVVKDFRLVVGKETRGHLGGTRVRVEYKKTGQPERRLGEIERMIRRSGLPAEMQTAGLGVFRRLAAAEARAHRRRPEEVHFHETGAVDAIVDIMGVVAGFHRLGIQRLVCSPLPLAGGEVQCAHGTLPLPAPATLELCRGLPVKGVPGEGELVTPTGAAIVAALAESFGPFPAMRIKNIGVGLGDHDFPDRPNLLRLILGEAEGRQETLIQLETAIDDMPAEHFDFLLARLEDAGALEVLYLPAQMKKNRPGTLVRVLVPPLKREAALAALFAHSTTLGIREYEVSRTALPRDSFKVSTAYGPVRVKVARRPDGSRHFHPEYDDLKRAAARHGTSMEKAALAAMSAAQSSRKGKGQ